MELSRPPLVVAFELSEKRKAIVADAIAGASAVEYLTELDQAARAEALRNTGALLTFNTSKELRPGEAKLLGGARLIQFIIAGIFRRSFVSRFALILGVRWRLGGNSRRPSASEGRRRDRARHACGRSLGSTPSPTWSAHETG
jgi:hypothetical protein